MKKLLGLILLLFLFRSEPAKAQVALNYYPFQSILTLSSNTEKLIWGDLRLETNTFIANVNTELDLMVNIKRSDWFNLYGGLGVNMNPAAAADGLPLTNGYVLCAGVRVKPIQSHKNFQVLFEIAPYANRNFDGGRLRTLLGVGYNF